MDLLVTYPQMQGAGFDEVQSPFSRTADIQLSSPHAGSQYSSGRTPAYGISRLSTQCVGTKNSSGSPAIISANHASGGIHVCAASSLRP